MENIVNNNAGIQQHTASFNSLNFLVYDVRSATVLGNQIKVEGNLFVKVTITDIAKKLGVHASTVSLALNNSPKISEATKKKVHQTAVEMGYQINPYVAALMSSIRSGKIPDNPPTLAFITSSETAGRWRDNYNFVEFYDSCIHVAQNLGMNIEHFWLGDEKLSAKRLDDILYNRGIMGGIFLPTGLFREKMNHAWSRIAAVSYGIYDITPSIDRVKADHFGNMEKVLTEIKARDFQRIGFVMETPYPYKNQNRWHASYLIEQETMPPKRHLKPMLDEDPTFDKFKAWFEAENPDVIICVDMAKVETWLNKMALQVPQDISLVTVGNAHENPAYSGMIENSSDCGKLAVEALLDRIHGNQIGAPESPRVITIRGRWQPGKTLHGPA